MRPALTVRRAPAAYTLWDRLARLWDALAGLASRAARPETSSHHSNDPAGQPSGPHLVSGLATKTRPLSAAPAPILTETP